jgi:hypothetical protein
MRTKPPRLNFGADEAAKRPAAGRERESKAPGSPHDRVRHPPLAASKKETPDMIRGHGASRFQATHVCSSLLYIDGAYGGGSVKAMIARVTSVSKAAEIR